MKNFKFSEPVYVVRVCKPGGVPPRGNPDFRWPRRGPVTCPDWDPEPECGNGLFGVTMRQITTRSKNGLNGITWLKQTPSPIFLLCEVEKSEIIEVHNEKVKFPRCNVVFFGSWDGLCRKLTELKVPDRPKPSEFAKRMGWKVFTPSDKKKVRKWVNALRKDIDTGLMPPAQDIVDMMNKAEPKHNSALESLTDKEAEAYARMMMNVPPHVCMLMWTKLQKNTRNLFKVHPLIQKRILEAAKGELGNFPRSHTEQFDYHISEILENASLSEKKWANKIAREIIGPGGDAIFAGWGGYPYPNSHLKKKKKAKK